MTMWRTPFLAPWLFSIVCLGCLHKPNQAEPDDLRGLGPSAPDASPGGRSPTGGTGGTDGGASAPDGGPSGTPADGPGATGPEPPAICGNGRVEPGETCDPPGDCPRACEEITCTRQALVGSPDQCNVRCQEEKITACTSGDRCCPRSSSPACTAVSDAECAAVCDNGAVESGENCEPRAECQRRADACKDDRDTLRMPTGDVQTCTFACTERKRPCQAGDSQCPTGCTAGSDPDCAGCGNGRLDSGETCDPCSNTSCASDRDTIRTPGGSAGSCTFSCNASPRPCSQTSDGQCPASCSPSQDVDCKRDPGGPCTSDTGCTTGFCVGGVCCSTRCTRVPAGRCGDSGVCTGGVCQPNTGATCESAECNASEARTAGECSPAGTCINRRTTPCNGTSCQSNTCGSCPDPGERTGCQSGRYCGSDRRSCLLQFGEGERCTSNGQCRSNTCNQEQSLCCPASCAAFGANYNCCAGVCKGIRRARCTNNSDCRPGMSCIHAGDCRNANGALVGVTCHPPSGTGCAGSEFCEDLGFVCAVGGTLYGNPEPACVP